MLFISLALCALWIDRLHKSPSWNQYLIGNVSSRTHDLFFHPPWLSSDDNKLFSINELYNINVIPEFLMGSSFSGHSSCTCIDPIPRWIGNKFTAADQALHLFQFFDSSFLPRREINKTNSFTDNLCIGASFLCTYIDTAHGKALPINKRT